MTSTSEHIAARDDDHLQARLVAAAEQMGYPNAKSEIGAHLPELVSQPVEVASAETSITAVHAYAAQVRAELFASAAALPPGLNPGAVTDDILRAAITAVLGPVAP